VDEHEGEQEQHESRPGRESRFCVRVHAISLPRSIVV
jgi:hypothetical protein